MPHITYRRALALVLAPLLPALLAGCGSASPSDSQAASLVSGKSNGYQQMVAFSQCMRSHGLAGFPDPARGSGGGVSLQIKGTATLNPQSPAFQSAQTACRHLLPNGGKPRHPLSAADKQRMIRYSQCIRAHGVPDFPDPTFTGGGAQIRIGSPAANPNSPAFRQAQKACQSVLPFAKPGGPGPSTSSAKGGGGNFGFSIAGG